MPIYEFRCSSCGHLEHRTGRNAPVCSLCGERTKRVYGFHMAPVMHEHLSPATGQVVSSDRQLRSQLRRMSEEQEARTGYPSNYEPVDIRDPEIAPQSDAGLKEQHDRHVELGWKDPASRLL